MRLIVITMLIMAGATLATEYALLDVKKRHQARSDSEEESEKVAVRSFRTRMPPELAKELARKKATMEPTGRIAALRDLHAHKPVVAIRELVAIGTPGALAALTRLHAEIDDAKARHALLEAVCKLPDGAAYLQTVAAEDGPDARVAQSLLEHPPTERGN